MSAVFEKSIEEWYAGSSTARLEYLDLAEVSKVSHSHLAHNISVVFDRVSLLSRVSLKNFKLILEKLSSLESKLSEEKIKIEKLEKLIKSSRPLTEQQVEALVLKFAAQPKEIEQRTINLAAELQKEVSQLKQMVVKIEKLL